MRLSLLTDYALRTLIYLAGRSERGQVKEIASFYQISAHHLAKVANLLARHGFVRGVRGIGGGLELARPASEIRLGEVVLAFEGNLHLLDCVGMPNVCSIQPDCKLRFILADAERMLVDYLNKVHLSDVVKPGGQLNEFVQISIPQTVKPAPSKGSAKKSSANKSSIRKKKSSSASRIIK